MGNLHQEGFNSCWVAQALTHLELFWAGSARWRGRSKALIDFSTQMVFVFCFCFIFFCWRSLSCFSCRSATLLSPKAGCRHLGRCLDSSARRVNLHKSEVSAAVTAIHSLFYFWSSIGEIKNTLYRSLFNDELTNSRASQLCEEREIKLGFLLLLGAQSQCKDFSVLSFPTPPARKSHPENTFFTEICVVHA